MCCNNSFVNDTASLWENEIGVVSFPIRENFAVRSRGCGCANAAFQAENNCGGIWANNGCSNRRRRRCGCCCDCN